MYIYLVSAPEYYSSFVVKIGCTIEPHGRLSTYLTGCPPNFPACHIRYIALWETKATTQEELFDFEDEVHDFFYIYRLMRNIPGDSEWFDFRASDPLEIVRQFVESRPWCKGRAVPLEEVERRKPMHLSMCLRKPYNKNLSQFIKRRSVRETVLNDLQQPVVDSISAFIKDPCVQAGFVIAPCGSGKTVMASRGIRGIQKCVICCPSQQIQLQWKRTLVREGVFAETDIYIVGATGTTNRTVIDSIPFNHRVFCIVSTYRSSHLLTTVIENGMELLVLDEAHHMAGVVAAGETGEGITRRLMAKAAGLGVKRLSLTYTPRFIVGASGAFDTFDTSDASSEDVSVLTMDDKTVFGHNIAELKFRTLVRHGVLPDYRLWLFRDAANVGTGVIAKAECILEAWRATEMVRGQETPVLHHLVIFAATIADTALLYEFFQTHATGDNTCVQRVCEGDDVGETIERFTTAKRAILLNCLVLNEGVDIPIADSVAIMYPKQSHGQITQMVLRAGRWYEGKSVFHVLLPTLNNEDFSGFGEVLAALASCDDHIADEIATRAKPICASIDGSDATSLTSMGTKDSRPECIVIEYLDANEDAIRQCFADLRKIMYRAKDTKDSGYIRTLCVDHHIETSIDYSKCLRLEYPELPENPLSKGMVWYDFLHPNTKEGRLTIAQFLERVPEDVRVGHKYDQWWMKLPDKETLPSVQHINDGYFGEDNVDFNVILREKPTECRKRR